MNRRDFIKFLGVLGIAPLIPKGLEMSIYTDLIMKVADGQKLDPIEREQLRQYTAEIDNNRQIVSAWQSIDKKISSAFLNLPIVPIFSDVIANSITYLTIEIPPDYKHLMVFISARTDKAALYDYIDGTINGDSNSSNYMEGFSGESNGSSAGWIGEHLTSTGFGAAFAAANSSTSGAAGSSIIFFPHYNSKSWKTLYKLQGFGDTYTNLLSVFSVWKSTSSIRTLKFYPNGGTNILADSVFSVYGIK